MPKHAHLADTLPSKDSARRWNLEGPKVVKKERRKEKMDLMTSVKVFSPGHEMSMETWKQWVKLHPMSNNANLTHKLCYKEWRTVGGIPGTLPRQTPRSGGLSSTQCLLFGGKYPEYLASLSPCGVRMRDVQVGLAVLVLLIGYPSPNERETNKCGAYTISHYI